MKIVFAFLNFLLCCNNLLAQPASKYNYINTQNGLPSNYVFSVCEDNLGFLWAATDKGICKFNGSKWEVWDTENGLPGNYVNGMVPLNSDGLWLTISGIGLVYFKNGKVIDKLSKDIPINLLEATQINDTLFGLIDIFEMKKFNSYKVFIKNGKIQYQRTEIENPENIFNIDSNNNHFKSYANRNNKNYLFNNALYKVGENFILKPNNEILETNKPILKRITSDNFIQKIEDEFYTN